MTRFSLPLLLSLYAPEQTVVVVAADPMATNWTDFQMEQTMSRSSLSESTDAEDDGP